MVGSAATKAARLRTTSSFMAGVLEEKTHRLSEGVCEFLELPRGFRQLLSGQNVPAETHFRQPRVKGDLNESGAESVGS